MPGLNAAREVRQVGVIVPAHNEQQLLPRCLSSILAAAEWLQLRLAVGVEVVVVLDRCEDRTAEIVAEVAACSDMVVGLRAAGAGVGAVRAEGARWLLGRYGVAGLWLATTDADSEVPKEWLVRQLEHQQRGADAVIGTVRVSDWSEHCPDIARRYQAGYHHGGPDHRHVHGANLSCSAEAYLAAGGFADLAADEDVGLVARLQESRAALVWASDLVVTTSARRQNRVAAGFAGHLRRLELAGGTSEAPADAG